MPAADCEVFPVQEILQHPAARERKLKVQLDAQGAAAGTAADP